MKTFSNQEICVLYYLTPCILNRKLNGYGTIIGECYGLLLERRVKIKQRYLQSIGAKF